MSKIVPGISSIHVGAPPPSAWSGGIVSWYGVYGSLAIYHWREPIISKILGCNWWPMVLEVYYPNSSPRALRRAGGWSQSLEGGQNMYSYGIVGTSTGFDSEIVRLKPL
jgi:hypothetical protein